MMNETENLYALFAVVRQYVLGTGGDGDGWIAGKYVINFDELRFQFT